MMKRIDVLGHNMHMIRLVSELDCSWDCRFEALQCWIRSVRGSNPLLRRGRAAGGIFHGSISGRFMTINQAMHAQTIHRVTSHFF